MDIRVSGRVRALAFTTCLALQTALPAAAATLVSFAFEDAGGGFTTAPTTLAPGLTSATLGDDAGRIGDLAGTPGRALSLSGFTSGNQLHLTLAIADGLRPALDSLAFDVRASASGPTAWELRHAGATLASGDITSSFRAVDLPLALAGNAGPLVLDFIGLGASAATGTLRIDNLRLGGSLSPAPVPLPGSMFLFVTPLLGLTLRELRVRHAAGGQDHSRQPSTSGKYRPSMMGRGSSAAMMRA